MKYNKKLIDFCNENYSVRDLYKSVMNRDAGFGKCFCPFHSNSNTPAAKIYENGLKCFGVCNHMYYAFDFLRVFFPDELDHIQSTVLLEQSPEKLKTKIRILNRSCLDLSQPIDIIIDAIFKNVGITAQVVSTSFLDKPQIKIKTAQGFITFDDVS